MWGKDYLNQMIDRTNQRISTLARKPVLDLPRPDSSLVSQVTIHDPKPMEVSVLYLDICDYQAWFNDTFESQKFVLSIMNIFMSEMMNIIRDYHGEFEKNTGDGLTAYFGCTPENEIASAQSSVEAALTMHYFNDHLLTPYLLRHGFSEGVRFRVGIDYGRVTIGRVGVPDGPQTFVAIGTTANIACRLLNVAGPGEIVIGQNVRTHLPESWHSQCKAISQKSGYEFVVDRSSYQIYQYAGRWKHPRVYVMPPLLQDQPPPEV